MAYTIWLCLLALATTQAQELPQNLNTADLQQLRHLNLEYYKYFENITQGELASEISQLLQLRKLSLEYYKHFEHMTINDLVPETRLPTPADLQCLAHMTQLMQGLGTGRLWAWKMIDSWGSIPSGIMLGTFWDLGNFDECIKIDQSVSAGSNIKGKYCFAALPVGQLLGKNAALLQALKLGTAICLPSSCTAANMNTSLKKLLKRIIKIDFKGQLVTENTCKTAESEPLDGLAIFTIVLLSLLGLSMVLATLYDYFLCESEQKLPGPIKCFSARSNSRALFRVVLPKSNPNVIDCLHGLRCLSLIWVIFGHQYLETLVSPNINLVDFISWFSTPFSMLIVRAHYCVDTFFFISGMLVALMALRTMKRAKGKLNVPLMYISRYLRLTPVLAVAILLYMSLLLHLGSGPLWGYFEVAGAKHCKKNWFWTLLYIQNYAADNICLGHTWYLAIDMQLYIISPIFLFALYKWDNKAAAGIAVFMLLMAACLFSLRITEHSAMIILHSAPWLIGLLFGYFLYKTPGRSFKLNRLTVWVCWLLALAFFFTCLFALYPHAAPRKPSITNVEDAFYTTFTSIAWPLGLVWVVFACMQGYGGMADGFLSSPLWQPLSRLSYCAYIFHFFIQDFNSARLRTNIYFSNYDIMLRFWSSFGFTVILSYVMYITVEAPLGNLQTHLLPNRKPAVAAVKASVAEVNQDLAEPSETKTPELGPQTSSASA